MPSHTIWEANILNFVEALLWQGHTILTPSRMETENPYLCSYVFNTLTANRKLTFSKFGN